MKTSFVRVRPVLATAFLFAALTQAQSITPDQTTLSYAAAVGGSAQAQFLRVSSSGSPLALTATAVTYNGTGNWLSVSPTSSSTPSTLVVSVNVGQLAQGVYNGAVTITSPGAINSPVLVNVTLTVGTPPATTPTPLSANPPAMTFNAQAAGLIPNAQLLSVGSNPPGVTFNIDVTTNDNYKWLQVSAQSATAPTPLTVSVNTAGLPTGLYTGNITLTPSSGGSLTVPVSLNLTSGTSLSASVSALQFFYQIGSFLPVPQLFTLTSGGTPVSAAVSASTNDGSNWLAASPLFPTTPQAITVTVNPGNLPAGVYTGKVHVSAPSAANQTIDIPVTLTVSGGPLLTVGPAPGTFIFQTGTPPPPSQTVALSTTTGTLNYTVSTTTQDGSNWLVVSPPSGLTPQNLNIGVNPGSLPAGNYTGTVTVTAPGAANSPISIPVNLSVSSSSALVLSSQSLALNFQIGGQNNIGSQPLLVSSTGLPVTFSATATTSTCGAGWLQVFPANATTPALLTVAIQPLGVTLPETCTGAVVLTPSGGSSISIPVTMNVSLTPLFNISPLALTLSAPFDGAATNPQTINLSVTDNSAVTFTALSSPQSGTSWLTVTQSSTTTPASLSVTANPVNLSAGTYSGSITISSPSLAAAQLIPITFKVTAASNAVVSPASLTFTQVVGGLAPPPQNVSITATGPALSFSTTKSTTDLGQWLSVTPVTGTTPGLIAVSVDGSALKPGTYTGSVTLTLPGAGNNTVQIPITLVVTASQVVTASPPALNFSYTAGGATPTAQTLNVTSAGAAVTVTATVSVGAPWLSVTPVSAATPAAFQVTVSPTGLAPGAYNATVTLTPPGASPITVPVRLDVTGAPPASIVAIANAASGVRGVVSPGEIVTITGDSLGTPAGASLRINTDGSLATSVEGTQVFFDEVAAPILFTSARQINTIVPYEIAGRATVQVTVVYQGARTQAFTIQTGPVAPGIFTLTQTGRGQGAILNQDNSVNGAGAPAARGSILQVFATGEGLTAPPSLTGSVTGSLHVPIAKVTAAIGGAPADVVFAGSAPGAVAGLLQVNVRVPQGSPSGDVPITISVGSASSQSGVTVAIR